MNWEELISSVMYVVITVIVPMVGIYIKTFLQTKIDAMLAEMEDNKKRILVDQAVTAIETIVDSVSQTYVDTLKAEGKFDEEAHKKAKELAIQKAKLAIAEEAKMAVMSVYCDFDAFLDDKIEAYLYTRH